METILSGLSKISMASVFFPLISMILSWRKIAFQNWKDAFRLAFFSTVKSLTDFVEAIISAFVIGLVMQQVITKPSAPVHSYDLLIEGFMNWLGFLFYILWSKDNIQLIKNISENTDCVQQSKNNSKNNILFCIYLYTFLGITVEILLWLRLIES